jgi:hypothetical protein
MMKQSGGSEPKVKIPDSKKPSGAAKQREHRAQVDEIRKLAKSASNFAF